MQKTERPNCGVLFTNDNKKGENHPDHTGKLALDRDLIKWAAGELAAGRPAEIRVAAWIKRGKKGDFLSLQVSTPQPLKSVRHTNGAASDGDDPPF